MRHRILILAAFLSLDLSTMLAAAGGDLDLKALLSPPQVGAWSSYKVSGKSMDRPKMFRLAVVGKEQFEGAPHIWLELTVAGQNGDSLTAMGLYPAGESLGLTAKKVVLKMGDSEAQEVPAGLVSLGTTLATRFGLGIDLDELVASIREGTRKGISSKEQAEESLALKGGILSTRRMLVEDAKGRQVSLWLSREAPLFSFVKAIHEARTLELETWGASGAVSRIGKNYNSFDLKDILNRALGK